MKKVLAVALAVTAALMLNGAALHAEEMLNGAGATFPYPVYSAWANEYNKITGMKLNYQSIGSGGGIKQIAERTVDFGASDKPLKPEELAKDNLLQFPAVIGGVVPVVNIAGHQGRRIEARLLKRSARSTWARSRTGTIRRSRRLNPKLNLPASEITVVHRSDGSGTTAIFTDYLSDVCPAWKEKVGAGTSVSWPAGIGGKGNEGVANYVQQQANSIGYVEFAYAKQNNLTHTVLKNHAGTFVEPSFESFEDAAATANFDPKKDFYLWLNDAPGKKSWPIAGATFILLAKEKKDSNMKVVKFFDWAFKNGDAQGKGTRLCAAPEIAESQGEGYWKANGIQ